MRYLLLILLASFGIQASGFDFTCYGIIVRNVAKSQEMLLEYKFKRMKKNGFVSKIVIKDYDYSHLSQSEIEKRVKASQTFKETTGWPFEVEDLVVQRVVFKTHDAIVESKGKAVHITSKTLRDKNFFFAMELEKPSIQGDEVAMLGHLTLRNSDMKTIPNRELKCLVSSEFQDELDASFKLRKRQKWTHDLGFLDK